MRGARISQAKTALAVGLLVAWTYLFLSPASVASADRGSDAFEQKCKACHTIGGGRTAGPDLKGAVSKRDRDWLIRFIVAPDQLIARGDPVAKQLVEEYGMPMPNLGISQPDAEAILSYIEAKSGGTGGQSSPPSGAGTAGSVPETAGDAALGRELFTGSVRLTNGGLACISCHHVNGVGTLGGGSVGKDLTPAFATFGPDSLRSMIQTAPFPGMREAFVDHPLTGAEVAHLVAFLQQVGREKSPDHNQGPIAFVLAGVIGLLPVMGLFQFVWKGRLQGVRQPLVKGGSK